MDPIAPPIYNVRGETDFHLLRRRLAGEHRATYGAEFTALVVNGGPVGSIDADKDLPRRQQSAETRFAALRNCYASAGLLLSSARTTVDGAIVGPATFRGMSRVMATTEVRFDLTDSRVLEERFLSRLRWYATRWIGDAQAGEDVAQETLKRVLQALAEGRVRQPDALPAFVYQTARHVCSHRNRAAGRERRMLARYGSDPSVDEPAAPDPLNELVSSERQALVRDALAAMEDEDRNLLVALYVHEQSPRQLAAELQLSDGALRVRKHRALKRLSERLNR